MCELTLEAAGLGHLRFKPGDRVMYGEFKGVIESHYHEGMFNVRLPGGTACIAGARLIRIPAQEGAPL